MSVCLFFIMYKLGKLLTVAIIVLISFTYDPLQISASCAINQESQKEEWDTEKIKLFLIGEAKKRHLDHEAVLKIVQCESNFQKEVVSSTHDYGLFQINRKAHSLSMEAKGYSIYKWEDTVAYGFDLMQRQGYKPWYMSIKCHGYK